MSDADLCYGAKAIATELGIRERQVYGLIEKRRLPAFRVGKVVCARRSTLATWLAEQEAAARAPKEGPATP